MLDRILHSGGEKNATCNNINESHNDNKKVLYKVQKQIKLIYGVRSQNCGYYWGRHGEL